MRTHPIDAPGTDEATWAAWPGLGLLAEADLSGVTSAAVIAAHPDDEVLGAGGLIALLAAAGTRLRLIAVTDGEGSHPGHGDPAALAQRRTAETAAALRALGAAETDVIRLGRPDSGPAGSALAACEDELTTALALLVAGYDLCLAPWEHDMHPDHEATGRAALAARGGNVYRYPVWMWHWATPGDPRVPWSAALRVPLAGPAVTAKQAAIGCFTSQAEDRGHGLGPVLSPGMIAHFTRPAEVLLK